MSNTSNIAHLHSATTEVALAEPVAASHLSVEPSATSLTELLKALADELRLQILQVLREDSFSVSELCQVFDLRQSALSHHLKVLVGGDWLVRRREGTMIFYRRQLAAGADELLRQTILARIDREEPSPLLKQRLNDIQAQREQNSVDFFRDNIARFSEQKELIASWQDYTDATLHLLDKAALPEQPCIVELGPGDGSLLPQLARRADKVIALDNSAVMLESARSNAAGLDNIMFLMGDTQHLALAEQRIDAIIANMVLHHTPDPQTTLATAASLLLPGGVLIISELCAHDQLWAREHCGDLWLGFAPEQLGQWAKAAGLESAAEVFIGQRNGFQIQVRLFIKTVSTGNQV